LRRRLHLLALLSLVLRTNQKQAAHNRVQDSVNAAGQLVKMLQKHNLSFHSARSLIKDASPVVNNKDASFFNQRTFESSL
jgi:hypothetical protein